MTDFVVKAQEYSSLSDQTESEPLTQSVVAPLHICMNQVNLEEGIAVASVVTEYAIPIDDGKQHPLLSSFSLYSLHHDTTSRGVHISRFLVQRVAFADLLQSLGLDVFDL